MDGPEVIDLQPALGEPLERGILARDEQLRRALLQGIAAERGRYGDLTAKVVETLQLEQDLRVERHGEAKAVTARALNQLLCELGLLTDDGGESAPPPGIWSAVPSASPTEVRHAAPSSSPTTMRTPARSDLARTWLTSRAATRSAKSRCPA